MFTIDKKITDKELKEMDFYKVLFSMNNHQVATPEMSLEEARSYVFFFREGKKRFAAYIGLHFLKTDRKLFYSHSANPFLEEDIPEVEDEARIFAEDMGAMLDELDFTNMSDQDEKRWIQDQSIFVQKPKAEPEPEPEPEPVVQAAEPSAQVIPPAASVPQAAPVDPPVTPAPQAAPAVVPPVQQPPVPQSPTMSPAAPSQVAPVQQQYSAPQENAAPRKVSPVPTAPPQQQQAPVHEPQRVSAAPLAEAARKRQEIVQKTAKAGTAKSPKESGIVERPSPTGVVSRDREALARLLTSF